MFQSSWMPHLFPHDNVEASTGLIGKHDPRIVIVSVGVHIERHAEVYRAEHVISCFTKEMFGCENNYYYSVKLAFILT